MPDTNLPFGGSEPDDDIDEGRFDESFPDVTAVLGDLTHLRPDAFLPETMPDWAWTRIELAIANEASARAVAEHDNVVALSPAPTVIGTPTAGKGEPHRFRWVGGLVAASAVILAVSVGVQLTGGQSTTPDIVAGGAPAAAPTALAKLAAPAPSAAAELGSALAFSEPVADPGTADTAAADQPAKMVMESDIQYTQAGLTGQVKSLLDRVGVHSALEAEQLQPQRIDMPVEDGFTTSWDRIRDCLAWLAKSPNVQAVVIDRATFEGAEAGVIIVPADQLSPTVTPAPDATLESSMGEMDVWVVTPSCSHQRDSIMGYLPFTWNR